MSLYNTAFKTLSKRINGVFPTDFRLQQ